MDEIEYLGATSTIQSYNLFTYCEGNTTRIERVSGIENLEDYREIIMKMQ